MLEVGSFKGLYCIPYNTVFYTNTGEAKNQVWCICEIYWYFRVSCKIIQGSTAFGKAMVHSYFFSYPNQK